MTSALQPNSHVFVVQESRYVKDGTTITHDYTSLYPYGKVSFLLPVSRRQKEEAKMSELEMLVQNLADFVPARDYLVFSGDPVLCAQAAVVAYNMTEDGENIQVLKWDRKAGIFVPVTLYLPDVPKG